jgi:hypothetical protein
MSCAQCDSNGFHTHPKRERGFWERSPRSRFGLVWPVGYPSVNRYIDQMDRLPVSQSELVKLKRADVFFPG